jgi:DNA-binding MarR family transcriptional regulator
LPSRPTPSRPSPSSKRRVPSRPGLSPGGDSGRIGDQLCFALYSATNALQRAYAPLLKRLGLTYLQYLVLLVLWERDGRTVGDIGRNLYLDSGTLTPVLRKLETAGLLTRRRAPDDEREVRISLTQAGARLEAQLVNVRAEVACQAALEPEAFSRLRGELQSLRARLEAAKNP